MSKVLFLADPGSIHDVKWISWFVENLSVEPFVLTRNTHADHYSIDKRYKGVGSIPDFSIFRFWITVFTAFRIKRIIKKNKIELVHIMYAEPNALWCLFRNYFNVPMLITCRGTDVLVTIPQAFEKKSFINFFVAPAYSLAFKKTDFITVTSTQQKESVINFSKRTEHIRVIRTGADVDRLNSDTSMYFPLRDKKPYVLFPRYIKPLYNQEFNLKAIASLPFEIKEKYKMVFVGKDSGDTTYQVKLEQLMRQQTDVSFEFIEKQTQESIFELYKRASLIVMTPISDGSPVSAMEAMLCRRPLILGPLNYDMDIFKYAIQIKNWSEHELAETISNVLNGSINMPELEPGVQKLIDRNYNMNQMAQIYHNLLKL